jgi:hypothetical protein
LSSKDKVVVIHGGNIYGLGAIAGHIDLQADLCLQNFQRYFLHDFVVFNQQDALVAILCLQNIFGVGVCRF